MITQPDLVKEIREHAAPLMEATDREIEEALNNLTQWWAERKAIQFPECCKEAAI